MGELRVRNQPLIEAISSAAIAILSESSAISAGSLEEAERGSYAIAWAQGRLAHADQIYKLFDMHAARGRGHPLTLGLMILEEEWSRCAPQGGASSVLEGFSGRSTGPRTADG